MTALGLSIAMTIGAVTDLSSRLALVSELALKPSFAAKAQAADQPTRISFVTLDKGLNSGIREHKFAVIRTPEEWAELWQAHRSLVSPEGPVPPVEFQVELVVAVFAGEMSAAGTRVEITDIEIEENRRFNVFFREVHPPAGAIVAPVLTQPFHMVKIRRIDLPAIFSKEQEAVRP